MTFQEQDLYDLKKAKTLLENPGLAAKIANLLGTPIEKGFSLLPENWNQKIGELTRTALSKAVQAAVLTMRDSPGAESSNIWHKLAVATTGGIGGLFGLPALSIELPISTTIMLRSIADVARSEEENIQKIESQIACIEVFALGGPSLGDGASESGYFAIRATLTQSISKAAEYIAKSGLSEERGKSKVSVAQPVAETDDVSMRLADHLVLDDLATPLPAAAPASNPATQRAASECPAFFSSSIANCVAYFFSLTIFYMIQLNSILFNFINISIC